MKNLLTFLLFICTLNLSAQDIIQMEKVGGVYKVPCKINGFGLKFIFDTGASDVSLSLSEAVFMVKNGYLNESDFRGTETYRIANGDIAEGTKVNLRKVEFGKQTLYNVEASIVHSMDAPLLLGQSVLQRLGKFSIDYSNNALIVGGGSVVSNKSNSNSNNTTTTSFTGTPLLGSKKLTNDWFGTTVSEYNFKQSIEDGATVPLFYHKRVPDVLLQNDNLEGDFAEIIEDENLTPDQQERLEREFAQELSVLKADDRLNTIAQDIAYHLPRRGYLGKGMVISVDKFTAVRIYDKVQHYWKEEIKKLNTEFSSAKTEREKGELTATRNWMKQVEMAVIISEEAGEEEKFALQGLDIKPHRKKINEVDENGFELEDKFKEPTDKLQLVFYAACGLPDLMSLPFPLYTWISQ